MDQDYRTPKIDFGAGRPMTDFKLGGWMRMTTARVARVQDLLRQEGLSALIATPGADMAYFTANFAHASERPQLLITPAEGSAVIVLSGFEARALPRLDGVRVVPYGETDDVYALVTSATDQSWWESVLVSDVCRSDVLLRLQATYPSCRFQPSSPLLRKLRMLKDATEIAALREAARGADAAWCRLLDTPFMGAAELEIAVRLQRLLEDQGLMTPGAIVASGANGASPHHQSGSRRMQDGDLVVIDFGGTFNGYWADMTRTVAVADAGVKQMRAYEAVRQANAAATSAVKPGVTAESVDQAARGVITQAGFGDAFIHRTGHGIGLDIHEEPYVVAGNTLPLESGMTFSVEPGVYLDGEFGIRIEDIVAVTDTGVEVLNSSPRDMRVVS